MKIYLASTMTETHQGRVLTKKNAFQRLLSYWHSKGKEKQLKTYIKTGKQTQ
jgi:hypothetical protein